MFYKPQNLKSLTVNLVLGLFKQCFRVQILLLFGRTNPLSGINWITLDQRFRNQTHRPKFEKPLPGRASEGLWNL